MGGVVNICTNVVPSIAEHLKITEDDFFQLAGMDWTKLLCGKINSRQFWKGIARKIHKEIEGDFFHKYFHPSRNHKVIHLIQDLRKNNRVVCGTNTFQIHYRVHFKKGDYRFFDEVYASHLIGMAKPDPLFYQYILDKEKSTKEKAVFIDDTWKNIVAARKMGIRSIHFVDANLLKEELEKIN